MICNLLQREGVINSDHALDMGDSQQVQETSQRLVGRREKLHLAFDSQPMGTELALTTYGVASDST